MPTSGTSSGGTESSSGGSDAGDGGGGEVTAGTGQGGTGAASSGGQGGEFVAAGTGGSGGGAGGNSGMSATGGSSGASPTEGGRFWSYRCSLPPVGSYSCSEKPQPNAWHCMLDVVPPAGSGCMLPDENVSPLPALPSGESVWCCEQCIRDTTLDSGSPGLESDETCPPSKPEFSACAGAAPPLGDCIDGTSLLRTGATIGVTGRCCSP